ncbi:MAG: GNAT family N-acetyltransferase [Puniceicoccaceae bacterium]|nr:MAG: GNAT family N-acetyltransferase [Puniceicoccaceae bacterium]
MPRIDLEEFQKEIKLRTLRMEDYDQLVALQKECFPGMTPWKREQLASQLERFAQGQICIEVEGRLVASSSSLIVDFDMYTESRSWSEISDRGYLRNHNPDGDTLYGIEIMVSPDFRGMKLARRLYEARKQLVRELNLMRIVIGGRLPGYEAHQDKMDVREYVDKVVAKALYDPVLTVQLANGFTLKRIIRDYLGEDKASAGYATFLEWTNLDYNPTPSRRYQPSRPVRICCVQYQMRPVKDFAEFAQQCQYFVDAASDKKCDFALFPELFTTQLLSFIEAKRPEQAARKLAEFTPEYLELFSDLSLRYNINLVAGTTFVVEDDFLYNVAFLFKRDGEVCRQYKLHVTPNEASWWGVRPGTRIRVFDTDRGVISIQPGYDIEFPEVSRIAVDQGAQLVFVPFCTAERHDYLRVRYCAQARCIENHVYVAAAGTVGNLPHVDNMDIQYAQSAILTPSDHAFARDGIAGECAAEVETVQINDLDLEVLRRHRQQGTTRNWNDRRKDLYEVVAREGDPEPASVAEKALEG